MLSYDCQVHQDPTYTMPYMQHWAACKLMKVLARAECSLEVSIRVVNFQYVKIKF